MTELRAGEVHLVGAGPGDPELLTVKAAALLREADVVLHDDLVPAPILALAGLKAMLINVGKRCGAKKITQLEINNLMIDSARRGMKVVRLKSGDPGVLGRLAEEIDALKAAGIPFEIVPGVTAAVAAAASIGASLTDRRRSSQILIVSGHHAARCGLSDAQFEEHDRERLDWSGIVRSGTTIAIYMPGHDFADLRAELLEASLDPQTPAVLVSRASTAAQQHHRTTVAALHAVPELPAPAILLIGKSLERVGASVGANGPARSQPHLDSLVSRADIEVAANETRRNSERRITL